MKKILWVIILLSLSLLSYFREVLFVSINAILDGSDFFYARTIKIDYLINQPHSFLIKLKYALTILFSLVFSGLTVFGLKISFKNKFPYKFSLITYFSLFTISGIILLGSILTKSFSTVYPFLREIIEYLHTPIFFILLSASTIALSRIGDIKLQSLD